MLEDNEKSNSQELAKVSVENIEIKIDELREPSLQYIKGFFFFFFDRVTKGVIYSIHTFFLLIRACILSSYILFSTPKGAKINCS